MRSQFAADRDPAGGRAAWQGFLTQLEAVDRDLAVVAGDRACSLELCLACWERDWNRNGRIDDRDRKLFELEFDGTGGDLAEGDPRQRPTFPVRYRRRRLGARASLGWMPDGFAVTATRY